MDIDPVLPTEQAATGSLDSTSRQTPAPPAAPPAATLTASLFAEEPSILEPASKSNRIATLEEWAATHAAGPSIPLPVERAMQQGAGAQTGSSLSVVAQDNPSPAKTTATIVTSTESTAAQTRPTPSQSHSETPGPSTAPQLPSTSLPNVEKLKGIATPPYHPPSQVNYWTDKMANPYFDSMEYKPPLGGVASTNLFRPEFFPVALDDRLEKSSIWMGIDRNTLEPRYFVPAACAECADQSVRRHCDRGYPRCGNCTGNGQSCSPGTTWRFLRISKRKVHDSNSEHPELKRSASQIESHENGSPNGSVMENGRATTESGRGKRVKKKRRLSADQIDPETLDDEGNPRHVTGPTSNTGFDKPGQSSTSFKAPVKGATRPRSSLPSKTLKPDQPLSKADEEYFRLLEENAQKPPLRDMRGACPVWSHTRRALCSATEYLRNPIRSEGASVEVGKGGVARGVILEGRPPGDRTYWGTTMELNGERISMAGTIVANIGRPRPIHRSESLAQEAPSPTQQELMAGPDSPTIHVINAAKALRTADGSVGESSKSPSVPPNPEAPAERAEINALRQAQKYGTPVAVALAGDYVGVPFKVPRKFIVLGWFWIVDSWLEPVPYEWEKQGPKPAQVVWRFRFEWCEPQDQPWWTPRSDPPRQPTPNLTHIPNSSDQGLRLLADKPTLLPPGQTGLDRDYYAVCPSCQYTSKIVYRNTAVCLNEQCAAFEENFPREGQSHPNLGLTGRPPLPPHSVMPVERVSPDSLSLQLRPPLPSEEEREGRRWAGKEWWKAWVCDDCGQANERRSWSKWDCQACGRIIQFPRKHYDAFFLRDPSRPVCDGPRQDDGIPNWPFETTMAWTLFKDDIKVIKHGIDVPDGLGDHAEVFHALNTEGKMSHVASNLVLRGLQSQGREELPLRRHTQPNVTVRSSEQYLSPFYTMLCGEAAPVLDHFPVEKPVPWTQCLQQTLDAIDLLNERVGRMWPGTKERFNSLLIAAFPPELPSGLAPHIILQPGDYLGLLFLGSDGEVRFRASYGANRRFGALKYQHGDVIGVKAGDLPVEIVLKPEGFGFVCLGRTTYKSNSAELEVEDMEVDFPALPDPTQNSTLQSRPKPREALASTSNELASGLSVSKAKSQIKPKLLDKASLDGWYIGPRPVNPQEPLRSLPVLEERRDINVPNPPRTFRTPGDDDTPKDPPPITWTGVVYISQGDVQAVKKLDTGPVQSLEDKKGKKKGKKGIDEGKEEEAVPPPEHNVVSGLKGKGKGKRASTASSATGEASVVSEPGTPASVTSRAPAKGKGKGRSSLGGGKAASAAGTTPSKSAPKAKRKSGKKANGEASSTIGTPLASNPPLQDDVPV